MKYLTRSFLLILLASAPGLSSPPGHVLPANKAKPQGADPRVQRMTANVYDRFIK